MRKFHSLPISAVVALCYLLLGSAPAFSVDSKIGVASAVKNQVQGRGARALAAGSEVYANERIKTGDASTAQFLFLDKTVLSLGPKAELMLDKFVYNPNKGAGQVVVNAVQGSFRFVTGSQNPNNYSIKTPVATLGIRGTVIDLLVQNGQTVVLLVEGAVSIRMASGQTYQLTKPGTAFVISANGQVKGPVPYDGTIINVAAGLTFPLYGWSFSGDPQDNRVPFDKMQAIDQINAINGRAYIPPVQHPNPQPSPCGPGSSFCN